MREERSKRAAELLDAAADLLERDGWVQATRGPQTTERMIGAMRTAAAGLRDA